MEGRAGINLSLARNVELLFPQLLKALDDLWGQSAAVALEAAIDFIEVNVSGFIGVASGGAEGSSSGFTQVKLHSAKDARIERGLAEDGAGEGYLVAFPRLDDAGDAVVAGKGGAHRIGGSGRGDLSVARKMDGTDIFQRNIHLTKTIGLEFHCVFADDLQFAGEAVVIDE